MGIDSQAVEDARELKQITYANGDHMQATYNSAGQMVAEKWFDSASSAPTANILSPAYSPVENHLRGDIIKSENPP